MQSVAISTKLPQKCGRIFKKKFSGPKSMCRVADVKKINIPSYWRGAVACGGVAKVATPPQQCGDFHHTATNLWRNVKKKFKGPKVMCRVAE